MLLLRIIIIVTDISILERELFVNGIGLVNPIHSVIIKEKPKSLSTKERGKTSGDGEGKGEVSMGKIYDLIIIGSGPAGLAAAIYAQRAKLDTIIIEENFVSGGQVVTTYEVDNYPGLPGISGMDLGTTLRDHAEKMGAEFVRDKVLELKLDGEDKVVVAKKGEYHTKTVIVATGAKHRMLDVPGEKELAGMGVSYCATCDGAFFRGKTVAVVGGGDVAVEDAIFLARACEKVYVIHRRDELRAAKILQERLLALENVEMVWDTVVDEIKGENQVEAVSVTNRKTGEKKDLAVNGIFIAVGITPNSELVSGKLEMDAQGYIKAQEDGVTSVEGVYAAGDVRTKQLRQILTAASDGANCVTSVQNHLLYS